MYNLTETQKLIYSIEKYVGKSVSNICGCLLFKEEISATELERLLNEIYRLNDVLRIRITENGSEVSQRVYEHQWRSFEVLHFSSKEEIDEYAKKYAREPMDITGSLYDVKIVYLNNMIGVVDKLHHIAGDAWSLSLLSNQICDLIHGKVPQAYSYIDYIETEEKYKLSKRYERDRLFFENQFKKCDEITLLSEEGSQNFEANRKSFVLDSEEYKKISKYVKKKDVTLFSLFLCAFSVYFSKVKDNCEKFFVGTAVLNRTNVKEMNTVGMYVNTVPVLIELENNNSFAENIKQVSESIFDVFRHERYNYGTLLKNLHTNYDFNGKLYDVLISYQNAKIHGNKTESTWYSNGMQNESLQIHIEDRDDTGTLSIHYDYLCDRFSEREIERLHRNISILLFDAIDDDNKSISELSISTDAEKKKLLYVFNNTKAEYPKDKCVHELFEEQVEKTPDKKAVVACDKTLSYRELNEESNRIAHSLKEKGIGVGDIVAFALPRKSYLIATMLGILKSGASYLPVDPDYPKDRIDYMLEDSKAKFFVTEDNITELLNNESVLNPNLIITSNSPCYCIYTSGSTGKPKGVILKHENVVNYVDNNNNNVVHSIIKETYKTIVSVTTVGFDIFVTESLLPLSNAMTIIFADEAQSKIQSELNLLLKKHPADVLQTTPSKLKILISDKSKLDYLNALKVIILGGEALDENLVKDLKLLTDAEIFNIYGPTETTVWSSYAKIENDDITIGKPIANTQIYIVDKNMHIVPIGVTGELCIAGDGVGAGYLNRPEFTAEKFIDNPFGEGKLYKTGDLAYWREDGNIVYVGRNDFQVKIRGLRIELGEIENAITSIDGIENCAVAVRRDEADRQLICAFYTGEEISSSQIRKEISEKLPRYMLPHIFTHLEAMPLTSSGKINRKALPEVNLNSRTYETEFKAASTKEEKILTQAVKTVLKREEVGVNENFFDIGGDSLKAIELAAILEANGYKTVIRKIFESESLKEIAQSIEENDTEEMPVEYSSVLAATSAQMRIYTAQMQDAGSTLYNIPYAFRTERVDVSKLEKAINELIKRHESLRTHFENRDGEIVQVIDEQALVEVQKLDSDDISKFIKPFVLEESPLIHAGYYEDTVMIDIHHIIADGESLPIFYRELNELYMGRELQKEPIQYGDFAVRTAFTKGNEEYWLDVFEEEVPVLELNTDYPRKEKQSFAGKNIFEIIDKKTTQKINEKCKELGITNFVYYMAAFNILLSKYSMQEDIVVGTPASGRTAKYLEAVGMFVNTLAVRNRPQGIKIIKEFLEEVRENSVNAIENQNYPFGTLVKKLGAQRTGRNPLYDVIFAYESEKSTDIIFADKKAELLATPLNTAKADLSFYVMPQKEETVLMAEYCTDLYKEDTIKKYISSYICILQQMLNEDVFIKDIEASNETSILKGKSIDFNGDATLYELFKTTAEKHKSEICIIGKNSAISFSEFSSLIERLDSVIRNKIGNKKQIIGVYADRSLEMYLSIYSIIRGGNAFIPIDVTQPQSRTEYMISDSGAELVLGQSKYSDKVVNCNFINVTEFITDNSPIDIIPANVSANDIAYVIYTSGTTGNPKGAMISHRSAINRINWMQRQYPLNESSVILQKTPYTFDVSVWEIFWWGMFGGKMAYSEPNEHFLPPVLTETIYKYKVTHLHFVPSVFSIFLDYIENQGIDLNMFESIRHIFLSGEALSTVLVNRFFNIFGNTCIKLHNLYGPTECAVDVTYYDCDSKNASSIPIGKPIDNTTIYILDKYSKPVPKGVKGELYIGGINVGVGYLNNSDLTKKAFIEFPEFNDRLYKTGDIGYIDGNNEIIYCGRKDTQIKINGRRIELSEIESVISSLDGISNVIIMLKNENDKTFLVAFYSGKEYTFEAFDKYCSEKLPKYMIPSIYIHLDKIPVNKNGKADRHKLTEITVSEFDNNKSKKDPAKTNTEKYICDLFGKVLSVNKVYRDSNFFDLGGTSLSMITVLSDDMLRSVSVTEFIASSTPAGLAKILNADAIKTMKYLEPLYTPKSSDHALVLFTYAGGDASAYSSLVREFRVLKSNISLYYVDWPKCEDNYNEIAEEIKELSLNNQLAFYSHCAGSVVALKLLDILNEKRATVNLYIAGANIPPYSYLSALNRWQFASDSTIIKYLEKVGFKSDAISDSAIHDIIKKFRIHTKEFSSYFQIKKRKTHCKTIAVISKNDWFTKNYAHSDTLWSKRVTQFEGTILTDFQSHYFQSENADQLAKIIINSF